MPTSAERPQDPTGLPDWRWSDTRRAVWVSLSKWPAARTADKQTAICRQSQHILPIRLWPQPSVPFHLPPLTAGLALWLVSRLLRSDSVTKSLREIRQINLLGLLPIIYAHKSAEYAGKFSLYLKAYLCAVPSETHPRTPFLHSFFNCLELDTTS